LPSCRKTRSVYSTWPIPEDVYDRLFTLQFVQDALRYNEVRYLVYDVQAEVIVQWQS